MIRTLDIVVLHFSETVYDITYPDFLGTLGGGCQRHG